MQAVEIQASGMVTGVGLTSAASCAAIRAGIARFKETPFLLGEEAIFGSSVPLEESLLLRGRDKLLRMATMALRECLDGVEESLLADLPIILCLPEPTRPGRIDGLDEGFLSELRRELDLAPAPGGSLLSLGRIGGAQGIAEASQLLAAGRAACVVVGVDSYLTAATLTAYNDRDRLKTDTNSDGFIPGEAAAAVLLRPAMPGGGGGLQCLGVGTANEPAPIESAEPFRADGLVQAFKGALRTSGCTFRDVDYRITDVNGEYYSFKEATLALNRTLREQKESFPIWHPVDCIGDVGAASGPVVLAVALAAARKGYAPGPGVLCHFSSDGSERAAMILRMS